MIDHDLVRTVLQKALRPGDVFTDLYAEQTVHALYETSADELLNMRLRVDQGVGIRRMREGSSHHVYSPDLSEDGLGRLVSILDTEEATAPARPQNAAFLQDDHRLSELPNIAQAAVSAANRSLSGHASARVTARIVATWQKVLIGRSDGRIIEEERPHAALHVEVVLRDGRKVRKGRRSLGRRHPGEFCLDDLHLLLACQAAEAAVQRLEAVEISSGETTVILGPGGPGVLIHEACGHVLEADLARQASSAFYGRFNTRVASPLVTVLDDPITAHGAPLYHVDDEGEPAEPTVLIEEGILRTYLYDRRCAEPHRRSNGHGRRLNYMHPPLPRMSVTSVRPGDSSLAEMIAETKTGIFVQSISGGDTDMGSGRFNLRVEEGYQIEQGKLTRPILGAVLSGYGPKILPLIDRVGNDCQFLNYCYLCNKLGQFPLVVSVGQPALRVPQMLVWGG